MIQRKLLIQKVFGVLGLGILFLMGLGLLVVSLNHRVSAYSDSFPLEVSQIPSFLVITGSWLLRYGGSAVWLWLIVLTLWCLRVVYHVGSIQRIIGLAFLAVSWSLYTATCMYSVWGDPWYGGVAWMVPGGIGGCCLVAALLRYVDLLVLCIAIFTFAFSGSLLLLGMQGVALVGAWGVWAVQPLGYVLVAIARVIADAWQRYCYSYMRVYVRLFWVGLRRRFCLSQDLVVDEDFWEQFTKKQSDEDAGTACALDAHAEQMAYQEVEPTFTLPGLSLFTKPPKKQERQARVAREIEQRISFLEDKLCRFGVQGSVVHAEVGPVVTLFEYAPAPDIKVSRISALSDDVALALGALSLRVIAPIPGKQVVGFEVANEQRQAVYFSELFDSAVYRDFAGALPAVIGARSSGEPCILDLAQQPHMLIAGSTGSGKSVVMHALLLGLLGARTPDEMRLVMIDPKRLEFAPYADIPHLMLPIVTQVSEIAKVFAWLVSIMENRYADLAKAGVRSVDEYRLLKGSDAMPYIVVVVDELADIMVTVGREVEPLLVRLAQMARAAAIHLVVATQRPSVDVVTGILKVNFPTRIALKVASKVDSRTVIDMPGAEQLLGKGDMLLMQQGGMIERAHGAFVQSKEVHSVASYLRLQQKPVYEIIAAPVVSGADSGGDALYSEVLAFVKSRKEISISLLQRHFRIGFNRSARLVDQLEEDGFVAPPGNGNKRQVL